MSTYWNSENYKTPTNPVTPTSTGTTGWTGVPAVNGSRFQNIDDGSVSNDTDYIRAIGPSRVDTYTIKPTTSAVNANGDTVDTLSAAIRYSTSAGSAGFQVDLQTGATVLYTFFLASSTGGVATNVSSGTITPATPLTKAQADNLKFVVTGGSASTDRRIYNAYVSLNIYASAPVFVTAPVASGTPSVGSLLSVTDGTWTNYSTGSQYQWKRNGVSIAGQTSNTHTVASLDQGTTLTCSVTVSNPDGSATSTSNGIAIPAAPPVGNPIYMMI